MELRELTLDDCEASGGIYVAAAKTEAAFWNLYLGASSGGANKADSEARQNCGPESPMRRTSHVVAPISESCEAQLPTADIQTSSQPSCQPPTKAARIAHHGDCTDPIREADAKL